MRKGFTLVELLAVIVILAVIALITIPAVMKMIDTSTTNSYRRSIDLYGKAVSQGIISYESDMIEKNKPINITFENIDSYIEYEGNDVDCKDKTIYSDRTILLTQCTVQDELVYGEKGRGYGEENYYYYTNSRKKMKLIKYIEAVEEAIKDKNISGTCTIGEDKITCNSEDIKIKSKLENAIEGNLTIENSKVKSYSNLKFETEKKVETNNEVPQIVDEQDINENLALETEDYRGYYADVDGDGTVDGVIYADLAHSRSGQWNSAAESYNYTAKTNLSKYVIREEKYKANDGFGEKYIISKKKGSTGNARFYVMALEDVSEGSFQGIQGYHDGSYYWYKNARDKINIINTALDFGQGYNNTKVTVEIWNKNGTGEGSYLGATQDEHDIWGHIQEEYEKGWYIPSLGEWIAFVHFFSTKNINPLNENNYNTIYNLSDYYYTSSQDNIGDWMKRVYYFYQFNSIPISGDSYFRLSITF